MPRSFRQVEVQERQERQASAELRERFMSTVASFTTEVVALLDVLEAPVNRDEMAAIEIAITPSDPKVE